MRSTETSLLTFVVEPLFWSMVAAQMVREGVPGDPGRG